MKKYYRVIKQVSIPVVCMLLLAGCLKDDCRHTYTIFRPVYEKLGTLRAKVQSGAAQALHNPGKLYVFGNRIYLNEQSRGIHVIDNSDPRRPQNKAFITVPGNIDIAMKGSVLYADMYCDLAALDVSNPSGAIVKKYLTNTFNSLTNYSASTNADSIGIITGWNSHDTVLSCEGYSLMTTTCANCNIFLTSGASNYAGSATTTGTAGSMARFATVGNYLYAADHMQLNVIDITAAPNPLAVKRQWLNALSETIYAFNNNLFIGSTTGMSVYDIQDGASPKPVSWSGHWLACDPVIADGNYAYVTLHAGTACGRTLNELDLYDISNLLRPSLVRTYALTSPQGLSKDGNLLFVCDGSAGLKVYDASLPDLKLVSQVPGINTYDVITLNGIAYVVTANGLYQYSYNSAGVLSLLSKLQWETTSSGR